MLFTTATPQLPIRLVLLVVALVAYHASVSLTEVEAALSDEEANQQLKKCCKKLLPGDDKNCVERFCDFDAISQTNVLNFLDTCTPKGDTVGHMWDCASSRIDHTECCKKKGVTGKCMAYCTAQDGVPTNYMDYLFCMENFNEVRDCFREHIKENFKA